jgi:aspartate aminotransferase
MAGHPDCEDIKNITGGLIYTLRTLGFVNASAIMQNAVRPLLDYPVPLADFQRKRDYLYESLRQIGYSVTRPEGAFYLFPQLPLKDDLAFADELKKHLVLTVPGSIFKAPGYLRVSYCVDDKTLEGSLAGFRRAMEKYNR